jgi:GNAT superfamily N-acetyltransferase
VDYRIAVDSDAPLLADINQQLIRDEWGGGGMELEHLERRMRRWIEEGDYKAIIFLEGGATVAYALVSIDEDSAYIRHFFVLQEHRGHGIGRQAIRILLCDIIPTDRRITLDVLASNSVGHHFWRSVGFSDYAVRMELLPAERPVAG